MRSVVGLVHVLDLDIKIIAEIVGLVLLRDRVTGIEKHRKTDMLTLPTGVILVPDIVECQEIDMLFPLRETISTEDLN